MKVKVHVGGVVELEIEDGLAEGSDEFEDALNDAWLDLSDEIVYDALAEEWKVKSIGGTPCEALQEPDN